MKSSESNFHLAVVRQLPIDTNYRLALSFHLPISFLALIVRTEQNRTEQSVFNRLKPFQTELASRCLSLGANSLKLADLLLAAVSRFPIYLELS